MSQMFYVLFVSVTATTKANLPFGRPRVVRQNREHCLLYHRGYISGFDKDMKMAMWSSYTVPNLVSLEPRDQWAAERFEL